MVLDTRVEGIWLIVDASLISAVVSFELWKEDKSAFVWACFGILGSHVFVNMKINKNRLKKNIKVLLKKEGKKKID